MSENKSKKADRALTIPEIDEACKEVQKMESSDILLQGGNHNIETINEKESQIPQEFIGLHLKFMNQLNHEIQNENKEKGISLFVRNDQSLTPISMKDIEVKEVIISTLATRGQGVDGDPVRRILQVYEKSGELIAEHDPELEALPKSMIALKGHFNAALKKESPNLTRIEFQHELDVAMKYLNSKATKILISEKKVIELWEVQDAMKLVREGEFIHWVENSYNPNVQELAKINTKP